MGWECPRAVINVSLTFTHGDPGRSAGRSLRAGPQNGGAGAGAGACSPQGGLPHGHSLWPFPGTLIYGQTQTIMLNVP